MAVVGKPTYGFNQVRSDSTSRKIGLNRAAKISKPAGISKPQTAKLKKLPVVESYDYFTRNDGYIVTKLNKLSVDRFYIEHHAKYINNNQIVRYYEYLGAFKRNKHGYIGLPAYFEHNKFSFRYTGSRGENYVSSEAFAALVGALKQAGFCDISLNHWSNEDGTSPKPSKSHKLGMNGDIRPLSTDESGNPVNLLVNPEMYDSTRSQKLVDALRAFGWKDILFYRNPKTGKIPKGTRHYKGHQHHFHVQKFQPKIIKYK